MNLLRSTKAPQPNPLPQSVRYLNELRALDVLFREGRMSRADLARALGLNRSTTGSIIANLLAESLVIEQTNQKRAASETRTGRPGIDIELNPSGAIFIGAGIEADCLTALTIDLSGAIVSKKSAPYHVARQSPEKTAEAVAKLINTLINAEPDKERVRGVCVALPAMLRDGIVLQATLLGWREVDLRSLISAHLCMDVPVLIENDANAFAIAETYTGGSPAANTVAFILIDSGAGGGIINGGRLLRGSDGLAGEFGHIVVGRRGYADGRGEPGALESFVGKDALLARYVAHGGDPLAELPDFVAALERSDRVALRTVADWGKWLARGLSMIINVLNPSVIIVGGPVGLLIRFVDSQVKAQLQAALPRGYPFPNIEISRFGPEGPAYGGALLLHQRAFSIDEKALYGEGGGRGLFHALHG